MKRNKMSLANITERLSRAEMKKILAGDREAAAGCFISIYPVPFEKCDTTLACTFRDGRVGACATNSEGTKCYCIAFS